MKPDANGHHKQSWMGIASRLWRVRKSGFGVASTVGEMVSERFINHHRNTLEHSDFYLDAADLGKGAGRLMANWMVTLAPKKSADGHFVAVNNLLKKLDEQNHAPMDMVMARYLASKIMLSIEGFTSETPGEKPYYEVFQNEARALLRVTIPGWERASRRDVFLATPFEGEALFTAIRRFLDALQATKKEMLSAYLATYNNTLADAADYGIELITLTYGREDDTALVSELEEWFERYRAFKLKELDRQQQFLRTSLATVTGQLHWHTGAEVWKKLFGKKPKPGDSYRTDTAGPSDTTLKVLTEKEGTNKKSPKKS